MNDNAPFALLNDVRKHGERRWQTAISVREDVSISALVPGLVKGGMYGLLHVLTIEVNWGLHVGEGTPGMSFISNERRTRDLKNITGNPGHPTRRDTVGGWVTYAERPGTVTY